MWIEIHQPSDNGLALPVTPLAGVWIEIIPPLVITVANPVTPLAGVWIEMCLLFAKIIC